MPFLRYACWLFLTLFALSIAVPSVQAQAWPQAKGALYVKATYGQSSASRQYLFDGRTAPYADNVSGTAFLDRSAYLYAEYGLTDLLTLVATVPYKTLRVEDAAFRYSTRSVGSVTVGARLALKPLLNWSAPQQALALNASLGLPAGYTRNLAPAVGGGQADAQVTLAYGLSLFPLPGYAQIGAGYRLRSSVYAFSQATDCQPGRDIDCVLDAQPSFENEWVLTAEAGATVGRWALVQALLNGAFSVREPTDRTSFRANNPIPTRQRFLKLGGGLTLYPVSDLGLSLQVFATPYGRNTIVSTDWYLGLEYALR